MVAIAILGATGHVGKSLVWQLSQLEDVELCLYARAPEKLTGQIDRLDKPATVESFGMDEFGSREVDVVINAVGAGTPRSVTELGTRIFEVTEHYDNLVMDYLKVHTNSLYLFISSGAIYGTEMTRAANIDSDVRIYPNNPNPQLQYAMAKLNAEAKHRGYNEFNIVDLRLFSYFSHFIDLNGGFFISDLAKAAKDKIPFRTDRRDFVRDFVSPQDFARLILCCVLRWKKAMEPVNASLDVYSRNSISKFDLLSQIGNKFDLEIEMVDMPDRVSTGPKTVYFSELFEAEKWGYAPKHSSFDCIEIGLHNLLEMI